MILAQRRTLLIAAAAAALSGPALAQQATNRTATIGPDKPARIAVVTALKKDCSVGEVGTLRITSAPKSGQVLVKVSKLKTPASFRCPNVETPVQELIYQPKAKFTGSDEISYETRGADGATQSFTVKINVGAKPGGSGAIQDL